ncbi:MAG: epoxyqueuosine reductase QueH [Rickettsiales bacterium]|jgi:predicted adenine nucleotide alpha hydrolase (AANH) superfamily ATPase|nr:epoxyqueuosine reductase QueH [Rickettsiales bacterium]
MRPEIKLVLMSCCAPCSAGAVRQLKESSEIADFIVLFYNPNIFPESEYSKRLAEQIRLCEGLGVKYAVCGVDDYEKEHAEWRECIRGLEEGPERGERCAACFKMRFAFGMRWARDNGYNAIASVFGVSRHKSQAQVDAAVRNAINNDEKMAIKYIPIQWDDELRQKMTKESDFYRQKYCGCEFSFREPTKK